MPARRRFYPATLYSALLPLLLILSALLLLTACGPERSKSGSAKLAEKGVAIARAYAENGDVDQARTDLRALDVANPSQWLTYMTESAIAGNVDAEETQALARLAVDLDSQSPSILAYAVETGLIEATPTPASAPAVAVVAPTAKIEAAQSAPAGAAIPPLDAAAAEGAEGAPALLPTVAVLALEPSVTPAGEAALPAPSATPASAPRVVASNALNVRSGPCTDYPIVNAMQTGQEAEIVGKNAQADWWQVSNAGQLGWVYGQLVATAGSVDNIAVPADIPAPPPTAMPAPVVEVPAAPPAAEAPVAEAPPAEQAAPAPAADGPDFVMTEKRLWGVFENGGRLDGPTVTCGEKHELTVNVLDANGNRLNGVLVASDFSDEKFVTGSQGKGDGIAEFVLWSGQDVKITRDADGRDVTSEVARGMTTHTPNIPFEYLMAGQFCTDDASCAQFATPPDSPPGCWGHFSWTVTFQRKY